jgi:hypothetical protein
MKQYVQAIRGVSLLALALGVAACSGPVGEEPLYVLRDALGRPVAVAGRSQLADAASGTMVRADIGGVAQDVMVGERVGLGPVAQPAVARLAVTSTAQAAPPPVPLAATAPPATTRRGRAATVATGANPSGRRREATPRSISRSVM